jgi:hypothetical protein
VVIERGVAGIREVVAAQPASGRPRRCSCSRELVDGTGARRFRVFGRHDFHVRAAGTGTLGQPPGLINEQAIPSESGAATVSTLLEDVQTVLDAGAPVEKVSIIASAADFAELMGESSNPAVLHQNATPTTGAVHNLAGIGLRFSPHLSTGQALTGDFSRCTVAYYGAPELVANPFVYAASGGLRLQAWQHAGGVVDQVSALVRRIG